MSQKKSISFEGCYEKYEPFIPTLENKDSVDKEKSNYSTINGIEDNNLRSNYSTASSGIGCRRDTVILLHDQHQKIMESHNNQMRIRSLKATLCFVMAILVLVGLVCLALSSLHYKLTHLGVDNNQNTTSHMEGPGHITNITYWTIKQRKTLQLLN